MDKTIPPNYTEQAAKMDWPLVELEGGTLVPMPRYKAHKEVCAIKILHVDPTPNGGALLTPEGCVSFAVDADYVKKHNPKAGGYYVAYADGYRSFSPAKALACSPGHVYFLKNFEGGTQVLHFIHKEPIMGSPELKTVNNGTTNEEVLEVLIDRLKFLNTKFPCKENAVALTHIETALLWLNKRTAERKARGVEGKAAA